ncbi:putative ripening-related protein 2 [Glycine soja]
MKMSNLIASFVLLLILISTNCLCSEAQQCRPSGRIMGKKPPPGECNKENDSDCSQQCRPSGRIMGKKPPPGECNKENDSDCCVQGKAYTTYKCSPAVSRHTKAELTLNSFENGGDGGGPSECDNQYHSDDTPVVALSTGWFNDRSRCLHNITISGNGKSVVAMVVDECDSTMGCDEDHDYQPPCSNNIVDASKAVWKALGVPHNQWGGLEITWSDA